MPLKCFGEHAVHIAMQCRISTIVIVVPLCPLLLRHLARRLDEYL